MCAGLEAEETNFIDTITTTTSKPSSNENDSGRTSSSMDSGSSRYPENAVRHSKVVDTFYSLTSSVLRMTFSLALPQDAPISVAVPFIQVT